MKIEHTKEMDGFFQRCWNNINTVSQNDFLGLTVSKENEQSLQKQLFQAGCVEFSGKSMPSLFISSKKWKASSYHTHIHLNHIEGHGFSYAEEIICGNELFNYDEIQKDPNYELRDYMKLRAIDCDTTSIVLRQDGNDWMLDAPSEAMTNDPIAQKAHGKVVTFGLGIGYFIYMCTLNPHVKEITVIEKSKDVIEMFQTYILPQFPTHLPIHIIHGDAFQYYNKTFLEQYDFIYSDIWRSGDDGLTIMTKLLEQYHNPNRDIYFWIENSCTEVIWTLIFIHFDELYHNRHNAVNPTYSRYMKKIRKWFQANPKTISKSSDLKVFMYDRDIVRQILATK